MEKQEEGKAYGFITCGASLEEMSALLPRVTRLSESSSELELGLTNPDEELKDIIGAAINAGRGYFTQASHPEKSNKDVATDLTTWINEAYLDGLNKAEGPFRAEVAYEERGKYNFIKWGK